MPSPSWRGSNSRSSKLAVGFCSGVSCPDADYAVWAVSRLSSVCPRKCQCTAVTVYIPSGSQFTIHTCIRSYTTCAAPCASSTLYCIGLSIASNDNLWLVNWKWFRRKRSWHSRGNGPEMSWRDWERRVMSLPWWWPDQNSNWPLHERLSRALPLWTPASHLCRSMKHIETHKSRFSFPSLLRPFSRLLTLVIWILLRRNFRICSLNTSVCKVWSFHGGNYEECRFLGCDVVWLLKQTMPQVLVTANVLHRSLILFALMEAIRSSETSGITRGTRNHILEEDNLRRRFCSNLGYMLNRHT
jgi:hypothetical protein